MKGDYWGSVFSVFWQIIALFAWGAVVVFVLIITVGAIIDTRDKLRAKGHGKWAPVFVGVSAILGLSAVAFGIGMLAASEVLGS